MTYTLANGVKTVEVRKVLDDYSLGMFYLPNAPVPGAITNVNETTAIATIAVQFTDAMKIEVVALANENGLTSLPSVTQQLLGPFAAPTKATGPIYSISSNDYISTFTYTLASNVSQVSVNQPTVGSSVVGTTATISVKTSSEIPIAVTALDNSYGLTSPASTGVLALAETNLGQAGIVSSPMVYAHQFGSSGASEGGFNRPRGIAVTTQTTQKYVYVADTNNHRIEIYTMDTSTGVATFNQRKGGGDFGYSAGSSQYDFSSPYSVAINHVQTRWAVADTGNNRIKVYNTPSGSENEIVFGGPGLTDGKFNAPMAVDFDRSGNIIVGDSTRIQVFSSSGAFIKKWTTPSGTNDGQINYPTSIAVNKVGHVVVSGTNGVQIFDANGTFLVKLVAPQGGAFSNANVAIDNNGVGQIVVSDVNNSKMHLYDSGGTYISSFGSFGTGDGNFNQPNGVSIDNQGNVYVCDTRNHRIQILT